ncbi:L-rhamnono-gamma-lactonase [Pleurostoma richardsiae]|uniref:L-rhamnono-gamma-lactonase n=1 Tax=Pleurostoma richardsiae TaxID=41990 RepID=A0AA38SDZ1_9PEZI|nr:L-rhamnono-gamma-lactonase [Pleurostoma richardsiae]
MASSIPIIDSHIHLYPASEIPTLAWCGPSHPLASQHLLAEYRAATGSPPNLRGFVFIETDRKNDPADPSPSGGWRHPLQEVSFLRRLAGGAPLLPGEEDPLAPSPADDARLCVGVVPWAPLPAGAAALERYLDAAREAAGEDVWPRVRGVRYLLQDKPAGTGLTDEFIEGLRLLGRRGLVFDTGVDQHRRGRAQLEECVEMIDRAHDGVEDGEKVVFIINHMCKPDLTVINPADPSFIAWRTAMYTLSRSPRVYMKVSGAFSEMPDALRRRPAEDIFEGVAPWLAVLVAAFGPSRLMFGSDWPVCTVGLEGEETSAWVKWKQVVERLCDMASWSKEEQEMIWGGAAIKAYGLSV